MEVECPKCKTMNQTINPTFLMDALQQNIGETITCSKCGHKFNITHCRVTTKKPIIKRIK